MIFLTEGAAAERDCVLTWRQEWTVNKRYDALRRAQGLCKAVAALIRVSAVLADLTASSRVVAFFMSPYIKAPLSILLLL